MEIRWVQTSRVVMALLLAGAVNQVGAQDNMSTYYTNGVVNIVPGNVIVGSTGTNNYLEVSNATTLTNGGYAHLGDSASANYNTALVSGTNSAWNIGMTLYVGFSESYNQFLVQNGAAVTVSSDSVVGNGAGVNNLISVTGPGSTYTAPSLYAQGGTSNNLVVANGGKVTLGAYIGQSSPYAQVIITNGGVVQTSSGFRLGETAGAFGESILIDGTGSIWTNIAGTSYIGKLSSNSQVQVQNGGRMDLNGQLYVGNADNNNQLLVQNGGTVTVTSDTVIGNGTGANNLISVSGAGATYRGASIYAQGGSSNNLVVANGGNAIISAYIGQSSPYAQVIITNGGVVQTSAGFRLGETAGAFGERILIDGTGSIWTNIAGTSYVGKLSSNSQVQVQNGGRMDLMANLNVGGDGTGPSTAASSNSVTVSGTLAMLNVNGQLYVGNAGNNNQVLVQNGGAVTVTSDTVIGNGTGANNLISVTGAGATYTGANIYAQGGSSNNLVVANGGKAIINTYIGQSSPDAQVIITNGGFLRTLTGTVLGETAGATGQRILVADTGSVWTNVSGTVFIGKEGNNSLLQVEAGGRVDFMAGLAFGGNGVVQSSGSQIVVANGGQMNVAGVQNTYGSNNVITVRDTGSVLRFATDFQPGYTGSGNGLIVTNGGLLVSQGASWFEFGVNSFANITGAGSVWTNAAGVYVGTYTGASNTITVSNSGQLYATEVFAGVATTTNNRVLVTSGGLLEANVLNVGSGPGNAISSTGGILQFTTNTPSLSGNVSVTNGTVSFRAVTTAPTTPIANLSYQGNNAFRLNNATNANPVSFEFDSVANTGNPTNYQRLELLNNARWVSDSLTNGVGGAIRGGVGDVVEIKNRFTIQRSSNPNAEFDLASATVLFSGSTGHTNAITGKDFGHSATLGYPDGFSAVNFSYGKLSLGTSSDTVCFASGDGSVSNALYVNWLDLGTTNQVANLHSPTNINIYYFSGNPNNAYLENMVYELTNCDGGVGGLLMPAVPEPSTVALVSLAALAAMWRRRTAVMPAEDK